MDSNVGGGKEIERKGERERRRIRTHRDTAPSIVCKIDGEVRVFGAP